MSDREAFTIGINLGTTNSSIAVCHDYNQVTVIQNPQTTQQLTPSYVSYDDGVCMVGQSAKESVTGTMIFEMKRIIGRSNGDPEVERNKARWPFTVVDTEDGPRVKVESGRSSKLVSPVEVSSTVLKCLKDYAADHLGKPVTRAVITVPAKFSDAQRRATREAGRQAGLEIIGMINEPTAAAIGYDVAGSANSTFMVFDFGGGTLDVSVLRCNGDLKFEVLASEGDIALGGADFDERLMRHYMQRFQEDNGIDLRTAGHGPLTRLRLQCEVVKTYLSGRRTSGRASVANIVDNLHVMETTTRAEFENLCLDLFPKVLPPVKSALRMAHLQAADLDFVLMVGGSSRIPKVRQLLGEYFGEIPLKFDRPDDGSVKGASLYARCILEKIAGLAPRYEIYDITTFSLGVAVAGGRMETLISKGTVLPAERRKVFTTSVAGTRAAAIRIYEGENQLVLDNHYLGEVELTDMGTENGGRAFITVTFAYDDSGLLNVTAIDKSTQATVHLSINTRE